MTTIRVCENFTKKRIDITGVLSMKKLANFVKILYNRGKIKNEVTVMVINDKLNLTMLCDFYELTMSQGYFSTGYKDRIAYFDLFFRRCPDGGGFAIAAGLEQIVQYIQDLHFSAEDIEYLRGRKLFSEEFLAYLADFKFTGDIWAVPEGTPMFPNEPIITVRAPAIQAQK